MTNLSERRYLAIKIEQTFLSFNEGYTVNKVIFSIFVEFDEFEKDVMQNTIFEIKFHSKFRLYPYRLIHLNFPWMSNIFY